MQKVLGQKNPGLVPGLLEKQKNERNTTTKMDLYRTQINRHHIWQLGLNHYMCSGEATSYY